MPGYPWKETEGFKLFLLNVRIFRSLYGHMKKKTLRRLARESSRGSFLRLIESRVDVLLMRSGVIPNIWKARHLIHHGHVEINGCKVSQPGFVAKPGDIIQLKRGFLNNQVYPLTQKVFRKKPEHLEIDYGSYRIIYLALICSSVFLDGCSGISLYSQRGHLDSKSPANLEIPKSILNRFECGFH